MRPRLSRRSLVGLSLVLPLTLTMAACGSSSKSGSTKAAATSPATALRLGYFANVTHAPALIGLANGYFAKDLGSTKLSTQVFSAGPAEVEALFGGSIDAAFVGPSPAINAFTQGHGGFVIVSGVMSGGAELVVKPSITTAAQLKGKTIATPQLGNTQDVALRAYLTSQGYKITTSGGDVNVTPEDNSTTLTAFKAGKIDGAWVPEPYASRLVLEDGAHVLVDEKSLWPAGQFTTTVLMVKKTYLDAHPDTIKALIQGVMQADAYIASDETGAETAVNAQLKTLTGKALSSAVIARAFGEISPTVDPIASSLKTELAHGVAAGTTKKASITGIFDLTILNSLLKAEGKPAVSTAGL